MKSASIFVAGALALMALPVSQPARAQAQNAEAAVSFVTAQPANEWLARVFLGAAVENAAGERVGDVNDLMFDRSGQISTVVLGVGGFLGMGEKNVAIPFSSLTYTTGKNGARVINVALTKDTLNLAPAFKATEKTTMDEVSEKAANMGQRTFETAVDLKDQAVKKIDDMTKSAPITQ